MKKTLSLLLVVVMMLSVMVIPAAAAEAFPCPSCNKYCVATKVNEKVVISRVSSCSQNRSEHEHYLYYDVYSINCSTCGASIKNVYTHTICP